jgi:hypothetical protein
MSPKGQRKAFENIVRLKRAEKESANREVATVRANLEEELGQTVSRNLAASILGVSHTALNKWIAKGDIPVVITASGRKEVPVPLLLDLYEQVNERRDSGERRLHALEPVIEDARQRADRLRPERSVQGLAGADRHRTSELRALAYHRALAPRLRRPMINDAMRRLERWRREGRIDHRHALEWERLFEKPMAEIRKAISKDDEAGNDLRQNSPLAGLLSEPERRKIHEAVR